MSPTGTFDYVDYEHEGLVHTLRIDNPPINLLTTELQRELIDGVRRFHDDPHGRCLLLRGQEQGPFSGGRDLRESLSWIESDDTSADVKSAWSVGRELIDELRVSSSIVIAVVEGAAVGGGAELLLPCDFVFASEDAEIGFPEIRRGLFPGTGGMELLPELLGRRQALEVLLLGDTRPSPAWKEMGLVTHVHEPSETFEAATEFADAISQRPAPAVRAIKELIRPHGDQYDERARRLELNRFKQVFTSAEAREGVEAFFEDREPDFGDVT